MPVATTAFEKSNGAVTFSELRQALTQYQAAAHATDAAMQQAEAKGDVATMQASPQRNKPRATHSICPTVWLNGYAYYHTIDRIFTSFPEIVFAGGKQEIITKAYDRILKATQNATASLSS